MATRSKTLHLPRIALDTPKDWSWARLDTVCEGIFDCPHSTPKLADYGPLMVRSQDMRTGVFRTEGAARVSEATYTERIRRAEPSYGDLLYSREGTYFGIAAEVPPNTRVCLGQRMVLVRPLSEQVHFRFLRYWLNSSIMTGHIHGYRDGTVAERLNLSTIRALPVPVPPMEEQRAIAHILGTLDDKIEFNRQMNHTLEAIARAIFKSWFVDFDPVWAKMDGEQPYGMDAETAAFLPITFVDSELGLIPEGWIVSELGDVLSVFETGSRPKGGVQGIEDGVPSLGAESIVSLGYYDYSKTKYVPVKFYRSMKRGHVMNRDVLLYKDGGRPGEFEPHVSMFGDGFPFAEFCINSHVYRMRAAEALSQAYLYFWMGSDLIMDEMRRRGTGVAIPGINSRAVRSIPVLIPRSEIVARFADFTEPLIARIFANCNESRTLAELRDTLLPKLISGRLRVPEVEEFISEVTL